MDQDITMDDKLAELVYISIGHASMCWSERPKGVFDTAEARKVAEHLLQGLKEHERDAIEHERVKWQLSTPHIIKDANGNEIARSKSMTG